MTTRQKSLAVALVATSVSAWVTASGVVGETARAVDALLLFATGLAAGASLATLLGSVGWSRRNSGDSS